MFLCAGPGDSGKLFSGDLGKSLFENRGQQWNLPISLPAGNHGDSEMIRCNLKENLQNKLHRIQQQGIGGNVPATASGSPVQFGVFVQVPFL